MFKSNVKALVILSVGETVQQSEAGDSKDGVEHRLCCVRLTKRSS